MHPRIQPSKHLSSLIRDRAILTFEPVPRIQLLSNQLDSKLREDLERLKRIRNHRGIRHYWGVKVRGQHTKTTGRRGKTMAAKKK